MMALNTTNTSTTKTLNLFGQQITVKPSTQGKTRLRDYNRPEDTINRRPDPFNKGFYNEYRNDIFIEFINGEYVLSSGVQGRKKFQSSDTAGIQNTIRAWEKEALHTDSLPGMKGYRTLDEQGSVIKGVLCSETSPLADKPALASKDQTVNHFSDLGSTDFSRYTTKEFPNLGEGFKLSGSSAKTVKHPSTFRGKTLTLGEKVQVNDLSRVFGSQDGKVYVELTEKGYIVSSPALDKQYRVNVNSPKSSQVIRQLEATVKKVETAVDNKIKPKAENVPQTLRVIGDYQDTSLAETPNYSGYLRGEPLWGSQQK
jgi:hypothetical protein